jgi:hypothetical protein
MAEIESVAQGGSVMAWLSIWAAFIVEHDIAVEHIAPGAESQGHDASRRWLYAMRLDKKRRRRRSDVSAWP